MSENNRIVWSEGLFLRPQHFQQQERYLESYIEGRTAALRPHSWGFTELEIERDLLAIGKLGLRRARGVFPDGTPFAMPENEPLPAPLEIGTQTARSGDPPRRAAAQVGRTAVARERIQARSSRAIAARDQEARDVTTESAVATELEVAALNARLHGAERARRGFRTHSTGARRRVPRGSSGGARRSLHPDGAEDWRGGAARDLPNGAAGAAASAGGSARRARRGYRAAAAPPRSRIS